MLNVINKIVPIGYPDWEKVWNEHSAAYPTIEQTAELLKRKFQGLVCKKNPTGDPNCPPYVHNAKQISRKIVVAIDGLTGGLDIEAESIASGDEIGMDEDKEEDAGEVEEGVNPPNLPPIIRDNLLNSFETTGDNNEEGGINSSFPLNDDEDCPHPSAAAAMPSTSSRAYGRSEKQKAGNGANPRKSCAFSQPLKTPRKSLSGNSKDGNDNNGFSFGQMMSYMVY
jgi:hypothetical protein